MRRHTQLQIKHLKVQEIGKLITVQIVLPKPVRIIYAMITHGWNPL